MTTIEWLPVNVTELVHGDIIRDLAKSKSTKITKIIHNACCSGGTHVNDSYCYDRISTVFRQTEATPA